MKLVTYSPKSPRPDPTLEQRAGILIDSDVYDIATGAQKAQISGLGESLLEIVRDMDQSLPALRKLEQAIRHGRAGPAVGAESSVELHSPIPRPPSMRDGYAFRQHVESARKNRGVPMIPEFDLFPVFYFTNHQAVSGPGDVRVQPEALKRLDFELEIAVVVGKRGQNIPADHVDEHIFGYTIMNDWSARELQTEEMKLNLGPAKGKDFSTSLGPYLVTRDELASYAVPSAKGERHRLSMKALVNGKLISEGNAVDMTWTFGQILERASYGVWLEPGDVIGSGTVGTGCLMELNGSVYKAAPWWIKPGDEVVLEVEGLGRLVNRVTAAEAVYRTSV